MSLSRRSLVGLLPAVAGAALLWSAPRLEAQSCFGPDNLDVAGACCVPVIPNLPPFPQAALGGLGICWNNCAQVQQRNLQLNWPPPVQVTCAEYATNLTVVDTGTGLPVLAGKMILDYTRTWDEITTIGTIQQVWRFVVKADLAAVPGGGSTCPKPTCLPPAGPHPTAFYYGYMDYTCTNAAGGFEQALVLYHACDRFIHRPGFSDRPGVFHPGAAYAIVAPHNALQPFVPSNAIAGGGPLLGEASREMGPAPQPPFVCINEDPVQFGAMTPLGAGCVCNMTTFPTQQTLRQFTGTTQCPNTAGVAGGWATLAINFPTNPWFHLVTTSIGFWSNPNIYPSTERAWVDEGVFVHQTACNGDVAELKYGGSTRGGWTPILASTPGPVNHFTDLADNYTAPLLGPYPTPILGSTYPTDRLIYVNEP